ncbi:MAG: hypothetical protein IPF57_10305 [Gammaproteobacteria bacterium]|jgi:hypothetical protein|nr:hypothetical protein [Gammaproteobacteria bacterium]
MTRLDPASFGPAGPFNEWLRGFNHGRNQRQRDAVYAALASVEKLGPCPAWPDSNAPDAAAWWLRYLALHAVWCAATYDRDQEPPIHWRAELRGLDREINVIRKAVPALTAILNTAPHLLAYIHHERVARARDLLTTITESIDSLPIVPYKRREMCLAWFTAARKDLKPTNVSTALAFNLMHLFRQYTGVGRKMGYGVPMPTDGKPCAPEATVIAAVVCGGDAGRIAESVKGLQRTRPALVQWPAGG